MKTQITNKPRVFKVKGVRIKDYGKIYLGDDEMVSFVTKSGEECDFTAKRWGFYLGPSLNGRLSREGFKVALTVNGEGRLYAHAVLKKEIGRFKRYLSNSRGNKIVCWVDEWFRERSK